MNRQGFIGGSDATAIMRGEWYDLWCVKTGRAQPEDLSDNIAVQLGIHTEKFNLDWFEKQNKCVLRCHQQQFDHTSTAGVPLSGTIDAMWNECIVEAKHTNAFNNMDQVIERYMPQLQLYMYLVKSEGAYLSVIFGNSQWESAHVQYDANYTMNMLTIIADFWRHVTEDIEPVGIDVPKQDIMGIPVDQMIVRDASTDNHFVSTAADYINHLEKAKIHERCKKDLKAMVADNEREVFCEYLTIKRDKRGSLRITKRI